MNFWDCVLICAGNRELISQFNRLTGHHMGENRSNFVKMFDSVCGYDQDKEAFPEFFAFVYNCIWLPLYG